MNTFYHVRALQVQEGIGGYIGVSRIWPRSQPRPVIWAPGMEMSPLIKGPLFRFQIPMYFALPRARAGEVVSPPHKFFWNGRRTAGADRAEILHSLWGIICAAFGKKKI